MYESTGSHLSVSTASNATSSRLTLGYRRKYHELSRNVSDTSVSRRAVPPHVGHFTRNQLSTRASGETPVSSG
jgi:hypothetical protein